jgi:hypothetical protein
VKEFLYRPYTVYKYLHHRRTTFLFNARFGGSMETSLGGSADRTSTCRAQQNAPILRLSPVKSPWAPIRGLQTPRCRIKKYEGFLQLFHDFFMRDPLVFWIIVVQAAHLVVELRTLEDFAWFWGGAKIRTSKILGSTLVALCGTRSNGRSSAPPHWWC